ncbi:glutamate receptor 2-like [Palaemon carinicauda]|uniref:glutamate receptor 2-like n=1 Tax=Palaemon carinicauda TaxID=392227 RepID=UPI0035B5A5F0
MMSIVPVLTPDQLGPRNSSNCLRLAVETWFPHLFWVRATSQNAPLTMTGPMIEISKILAKKLNRSCIEYVWSGDGTFFGVRHDNGSWDGLTGLLARNLTEMTGVPITIEHSRLEVVEFSQTLFVDSWNLAYKRPELQSDISGFVKPFTMLLWSLIAAIMIAVFAGLFFVEYRHKKLRTCKWYPSGDSVRLLSGLWLLMALIISTLYRSNLKAMLILPKIVLPFNNIQELVRSDIPLHVAQGSTLSRQIQNSLPGTSLHAIKNYPNQILSSDPLQVFADTLKGRNAVFVEALSILYGLHTTFAARRKCELYLGEEHFSTVVGQTLATPKGSPIKDQIDFIYRDNRSDLHLYA